MLVWRLHGVPCIPPFQEQGRLCSELASRFVSMNTYIHSVFLCTHGGTFLVLVWLGTAPDCLS